MFNKHEFTFSSCTLETTIQILAKLKTASPPAIIQIRYSAIPDAVVNAAVKQISEKAPYGIGMKNVEETVKKYAGTLNTEVKDGKYITDVILYELE